MEGKYKGLSNIGATCYMNSLLQTLFMTPQFRQIVYKWKYDKNIHPKQSDSILYQLQKLFAKLQTNFPGIITTQQLAKSFQWQEQDAHVQQDIQQFNRVLFEALEKSLIKNDVESAQRLKDQFEGSMIHFTKCSVCGYESLRQEVFQDIILPIKNVYEKVYNNNVPLAIQMYMKPQKLDANNLFECEACQVKVQVERGVRFLKMPKLLNLVLQRFSFDYNTFERQKINDFVEFPFVMNFNNYMYGYEKIPNKLNEDSSAYFLEQYQPPKKTNYTSAAKKFTKVPKKNNQPSVAGKIKTKPLPETKQFLKQIRKNKTANQESQDLIFVSGTATNQSTTANQQPNLKTEVQNDVKKDIQIDQNSVSKMVDEKKIEELPNISMLPPPPPLTLLPTELSNPYANPIISTNTITLDEQFKNIMKQKQQFNEQKQVKLRELQKQNQQIIQQHLKDGPLVYELYSVMIHNGSATHGHYYSYIKSFEDNRWYCFNDERVTEINVLQINKAFGGNGSSASAYGLYYRLVENQKNMHNKKIEIPLYIERAVEQQATIMKLIENQKIMNIDNLIILKIHYQLYVKQLQIYKNQTLRVCLEKSKELFSIGQTIKSQNIRLRMYNPVSDIKLDTYTGKQDLNLQQLGIGSYRSMVLQTKSDNQVFEQFQPGFMSIRIVFWEQSPSITSLDQANLKLHKVSVNRFAKINSLQQIIRQKIKSVLNIDDDILIIKRHINDEHSYHQVINDEINSKKSLQQIGIFEGQIIFIQKKGEIILWALQFQNQLYRINVKYNLPDQNSVHPQYYNILTDSRKTLLELKKSICDALSQQPQSIIIRRGNKSGIQLKNTSMTLKELKFINGSQLYLEKGIAAQQGQIRVHLYFANDADVSAVNRLHEFQYIADIPISSSDKASQVKQVFAKWVKKLKGIELNICNFRIRQKVSQKIGKIYREKPMKQQQLIEKRQIAIQFKQDNVDIKDFSIYVRFWDVQNWTLSPKHQIIVNKNTSMIDLAQLIQKTVKDIHVDKIQICRVLSIHKFSMLDLVEMEYFNISDLSVIGQPLFVNSDGLLYIIKDGTLQPRNLTVEEQKKFGGTLKIINRVKNVKQTTQNQKKQKGVVIKVVEKQLDKQQAPNKIEQ